MSVFNTYAFTVRGAQIGVEKAQNTYRIDVSSGDVTVVVWLRAEDAKSLSTMITSLLPRPLEPEKDEPVTLEHQRRDVRHAWTDAVNDMSIDNLSRICYDVGVDYENLPGNTKTGKGIELFNFLRRSTRTHLLEPYYKKYL